IACIVKLNVDLAPRLGAAAHTAQLAYTDQGFHSPRVCLPQWWLRAFEQGFGVSQRCAPADAAMLPRVVVGDQYIKHLFSVFILKARRDGQCLGIPTFALARLATCRV